MIEFRTKKAIEKYIRNIVDTWCLIKDISTSNITFGTSNKAKTPFKIGLVDVFKDLHFQYKKNGILEYGLFIEVSEKCVLINDKKKRVYYISTIKEY